LPIVLLAVIAGGCQSPYRADQGALFGGLLGAGTGAIVGNALGNTGAGAAIGAGVGALSGATVGGELDKIEAQNRAMIAQQLGREVAANAVTTDDVIAMTRASVNEELIVNHVRAHGVVAPLRPADLIFLQQQGVSPRVIAAMQSPPVRPAAVAQPVVVQPAPAPVIVEEYHYAPFWGPPCYYHRPWHPRPGVSWGMSFSN
jgi:outer membrane lipoprotein SlyB